MVSHKIKKPKKLRIKRVLEDREPKLVENIKKCLILKGGNTSLCISSVLKDLHRMKKPNCILYKKKNVTRPFEDESSLEFFSQQSDASLFIFGSDTKKRPNNLILGRMFDHHILDMVEFGVVTYLGLDDFANSKVTVATKPCLLFMGEQFDGDPTWRRVKSLMTDLFRGEEISEMRLNGVEHVWSFSVSGETLCVRSYRIILKKSGTRTPRVELEEIGPLLDLTLRRHKIASDDLFKNSCKQPKEIKVKKVKNMGHDVFGTKCGRVHMERQDLSKLETRKMKGLKRRRSEGGEGKEKRKRSEGGEGKEKRMRGEGGVGKEKRKRSEGGVGKKRKRIVGLAGKEK